MRNQLQHYVPRFLLRQFGKGKKDHVRVMDKQTGRKFSFSASKKALIAVAAEYGMYDFEFMGQPVSIESNLASLESKAAESIARLSREEKFDLADPMERATLACFLAVQMVRTRAVLETQADMMARMTAWLKTQGAPAGFFEDDPNVGSGENADKALLARLITNAPKDLAPAFVEKDWLLVSTDRKHPFLMGDHPITLFNDVDMGPWGNLGITVEGIQVYFPLSPTLALAIWCPSLRQRPLDLVDRLAGLSEAEPDLAAQHVEDWQHALSTLNSFRLGTPLAYRPEHVDHFNSLQVAHAERFVFSSDGNFALVEEMIRRDSTMRKGRRMSEATGKF